jgi:hypothetical protein
MTFEGMEVIYKNWSAEKPLLAIADTSHSTLYARTVMKDLQKAKLDRNTAWLPSGIGESLTSAIILSDDVELMNHDLKTDLHYCLLLVRRICC